jgi:hypothetical protein
MNSRMSRRERTNSEQRFRMNFCAWMAAVLLLGSGLRLTGQGRLAGQLDQYLNENDPVRKARLLVKLGDEEIEQAKKHLQNGNDVASLQTLEQYRDQVGKTISGLKATGANAERKPAGFKELQISLRENIRRIDDLILSLPVDKRPFFREVRTALVQMQNELIDALFPRQGSGKKANP